MLFLQFVQFIYGGHVQLLDDAIISGDLAVELIVLTVTVKYCPI
jgi:hypothetical protein